MASQSKHRRAYHPAVSIFSWMIFAIAVELASPGALAGFALVAGMLLTSELARRRFLQLLWKSRWLFLALTLFYAYSLPGVFIWQGPFSPSHEGLQAAVVRLSRLVLLLAALARLLTGHSPAELAAGLYILARPLAWVGFDRRAFAVRLSLALEQVDGLSKKTDWRRELSATAEVSGPALIRLNIPPVQPRDLSVLAFSCAILVLAGLSV